ncbi:glutamate 5-kinase [Flavilitoribacter nigricans]|uniref:Glutamate 5-kinase n=1 Tax=Flavilitoribacter nigricans (strain ATCC 23147 / DSM 23189 / NBRC 102662 / NCIMB 1420 / SS-2) TaxID=1122177 RepID=A0A2D0N6T7_FLAN2|nr:glutamate 5-kinase [Flavilitoribacter nigricans]PHN04096.1 glutamate 5-kinase [Flavilitoribacter nigricans DSM 23189 = NBRC 102662]
MTERSKDPLYNCVVVKVGTNVLTRPDGLLDMTSISGLVDQIAELKRLGISVILVSSGAVGAGRSLLPLKEQTNKVVRRQVLSSIGQVRLMEIYRQFFLNHGLFCAQVLATKEDFRDRRHYLNMKNCFLALLRDQVVPVVNENDVISVTELMFTDNDELAGLVAAMINAEALIILSSVDGVLDGPPDEAASRVIPEIDPADPKWEKFILPSRSSFGRGGMHTKFRIAGKAAKVGIATYIANGRRADVLPGIVQGENSGTLFRPKEGVSGFKKWIAYNESTPKGKVRINAGAEEALRSPDRVTSLLPVGIEAVMGTFEKGDIIHILNEKEEIIGWGIAQYDYEKARSNVGKKGKKALVHYDYLYIEG